MGRGPEASGGHENHGMKRRSTRIVAAFTVLVLLGCSPLRFGYSTGKLSVVAGRGYLDLFLLPPDWQVTLSPATFFTDHGMPFLPAEVADVFPRRYPDTHFVLPLYLPAFLLLGTLVWMLTRKTPRPGHCRKCGYDLTGNVSGCCSECRAVTAA